MVGRWIIGAVTVAAGLYGLYALRWEWRGGGEINVLEAPEWWPFDLPAWRALIRSGPLGVVEAPFAGAAIIASGLEGGYLVDALQFVFSGLATVTLALLILVALINRPAALVAPRFRQFPGAIDEWRGAPIPTATGPDEVPSPRHPQPRR
jgi:hypothetical protein